MGKIKMKFSKNYYSKQNLDDIMALRTFALHELIFAGLCLLIMSTVSMIMFYNYFNDSIVNAKNYLPDSCIISSIEIKTISFKCWDMSGYVTVVDLPCLKMLADSRTNPNLTFYRNIQEKVLARDSKSDVRLKFNQDLF